MIHRRLALPLAALLLALATACSGAPGAPAELGADLPQPADVQEADASAAGSTPSPLPTDPVAPTEDALAGDAAAAGHHGHGEEHGERGELPTGEELIVATRADAGRWADVADAEAAGYRSIGDAFTGYEHLVHPELQADATILEPTRPESLVYRVEGGERTYVSAMFLLPPGSTMDDVPDLGDERAVWHLHDDLCFDDEGRLAGVFRDGTCLFGGEHRVTPPMLHVWVVDHPCGPFAGIEGHGEACASHDH